MPATTETAKYPSPLTLRICSDIIARKDKLRQILLARKIAVEDI